MAALLGPHWQLISAGAHPAALTAEIMQEVWCCSCQFAEAEQHASAPLVRLPYGGDLRHMLVGQRDLGPMQLRSERTRTTRRPSSGRYFKTLAGI